jgi:6-phosphogluconolactonase
VSLAARSLDPSYLAIARGGRHLYAVNELTEYQGEKSGAVEAFAIDAQTHDLTSINQLASGGGAPCHLTLARDGKALVVANYVGGNVASYPLRPDGGLGARASLIQHEGHGPDSHRQQGPHAHATILDPAGKRVYVCDLGLDRVIAYAVDDAGAIAASGPGGNVAPGAGPRHIAFHPNGRFAYVNNEMACTVTAFSCDAGTGALSELHSLPTLPEGFTGGRSTAQVLLTPDARWLYVSNRGHDSLAMYAVDQGTGRLTALGHQPTGGKTPRDFGIDPTGTWLLAANQDSDTVVVFRIDRDSGRLAQVGAPVPVPRPVCVVFTA